MAEALTGFASRPSARPFLACAGIAAIVAVWYTASGRWVNAYYIGNPWEVALQIGAWLEAGTLLVHLQATLASTLLGFALAAPLALLLALILGSSESISAVLHPFVLAAFAIPKIILAPLIIVWVGIGFAPCLVLAAVTAFFLVFFNVYGGVRATPPALLATMRLLGAGPVTTALKVRLPAAMPFVVFGLRLGLIYAFHGAVVGEMTASNRGLGYLIIFSATRMDSNAVIAGLVVLGAFALLFVGALDWMVGRLPGMQSQRTLVS